MLVVERGTLGEKVDLKAYPWVTKTLNEPTTSTNGMVLSVLYLVTISEDSTKTIKSSSLPL